MSATTTQSAYVFLTALLGSLLYAPFVPAATTKYGVFLANPVSNSMKYRAAAVQYTTPTIPQQYVDDNARAHYVIHRALDELEEIVSKVGQEKANIVVLPEGSIGWTAQTWLKTRQQMTLFCESLRKPFGPIALRFSRMASDYHVVVVASMCVREEERQHNSLVVFDVSGEIVAVNHKRHLFGTETEQFDAGDAAEPLVTFTSSFGVRFGLMVCFDMEFSSAMLSSPDAPSEFLLSMAWSNVFPLQFATEMQQAWSRAFSLNVVAANAGNALSNGGGIFSYGAPLSVSQSPLCTLSNQFNIADLRTSSESILIASPHSASTQQEQEPTSRDCLLTPGLTAMMSRCVSVPMGDSELLVSHGSFTCRFRLSRSSAVVEDFVAFAYEGTLRFGDSGMGLQACGVTRALAAIQTPEQTQYSRTVLHSFSIDAVDSLDRSGTLFPFASFSGGELLEPQVTAFTSEGRFWSTGQLQKPLLNAALWNVLEL